MCILHVMDIILWRFRLSMEFTSRHEMVVSGRSVTSEAWAPENWSAMVFTLSHGWELQSPSPARHRRNRRHPVALLRFDFFLVSPSCTGILLLAKPFDALMDKSIRHTRNISLHVENECWASVSMFECPRRVWVHSWQLGRDKQR